MKLSAKTGVALTITALSLVVTVGAGASPVHPAEELHSIYVKQLSPYPDYVDMMNQLRNLTEPNAINWGWSQGLANDQASASARVMGVEGGGGNAARDALGLSAQAEQYVKGITSLTPVQRAAALGGTDGTSVITQPSVEPGMTAPSIGPSGEGWRSHWG